MSQREEYEKGIKVEREHKETYNRIAQYVKKFKKMPDPTQMFIWIAQDHIQEDPEYYSKLGKAGL